MTAPVQLLEEMRETLERAIRQVVQAGAAVPVEHQTDGMKSWFANLVTKLEHAQVLRKKCLVEITGPLHPEYVEPYRPPEMDEGDV